MKVGHVPIALTMKKVDCSDLSITQGEPGT